MSRASQNGVSDYVLVSSVGASPSSRFFYNRLKGELDEAVQHLPFKRLFIFRPPSLIRKDSTRWAEKVSVKLLKVLNALGLLSRHRPLPTEKLAQAMIRSVKSDQRGIHIIPAEEI